MAIIREGRILFYAQSDVTCYVLRGSKSDLLIDTGLPFTRRGMLRWLHHYRIQHILLTHAHPDHDWNAAYLQRNGAKLLLSSRDRWLRQDFLSQKVQPTAPRYRLRNVVQCVGGALVKSPAYEADVYLRDSDAGYLHSLGFDAELIPLPGHTYGSVGVLSDGVLYCGDAFTALWGKPDITPHAVHPALMCRSLARILKLQPEWLACGHGLPVRMRDAAPVIHQYLETAGNSQGFCR